MDLKVRSVPKPKSKPKERPKFKAKRTYKKKKKPEMVKGRTIPPSRVRGSISKKEYQKAIEHFGTVCVFCSHPLIEMHHIRFRSQQGRGQYRNLIPLCKKHHALAHTSRIFADQLREERTQQYSEWYWCDKYDLFKAGLITNTEENEFEKFMLEQEKLQ